MKIKIRKTDSIFSLQVRAKAGWLCESCGDGYGNNPQGLHASHYWGRGRENTRFDFDNCMALCFYCHMHLGHGDRRDEYTELMIKKLGNKGFKELKVRAFMYKKRDDKLVMLALSQGNNKTSTPLS